MAWHSAGTYWTIDGRGGADGGLQRLAPLNSWPDNGNLDKATRLLWPLKQKYGRKISWADPLILAGTVAMDSMGFETLGCAGGHTFGKAHGAADPAMYVGVEPEGGDIEAQGFGWDNTYGSGHGADTITSGLEGAWTFGPAAWTHNFLENLYGYEWVETRSPAGAIRWEPADGAAADLVPDAHDPSRRHAPMMLTTDLALKVDPAYREITSRWLDNPEATACPPTGPAR